MADSTDNLGQVGEDTSALIAAADADRNARARERRQQRKQEIQAQGRGDLLRVSINGPHKAQCNGKSLALFISSPEQNNSDQKGFNPNGLKIYALDGTTVLKDGAEPTLKVSDTVTVTSALYVTEFCVDSVTYYALVYRSVFSSNSDMS